MIIDSSAVVAMVFQEAGWEAIRGKVSAASPVRMSAATYVEVGIVIDRRGSIAASRGLDQLLTAWGVEIVDLTADHAAIARHAYRDYGKGSGHPAGLNFGDCFSYALASATGEPLLFVGDDFAHTDLVAA